MLSPGKYHESVPKDLPANLRFRINVLEAAAQDPNLQRGLVEMCRQDVLFFINTFVYQYNPKKKGREAVGPFITWPFQDRALLDQPPRRKGILWYYEHDRTAVVEKSREMGASWLFLIFQDWLCLFHGHVQAFNISRSADAVDSKSRNSLFAKIRFMHEHMPAWLTGEMEQTQFYFNYKRSRSEVTGEASTGRAGAGGRASVVFVDEFPEIREDTKVRQNTASITDCRFFNGTHLGTHTEFYDLTTSPEIGKIQFHWTRHPDKNKGLYSWDGPTNRIKFWRYDDETDAIVSAAGGDSANDPDYNYDRTGKPLGGPHPGIRSPWYDQKCKDIGNDRGVAMELDIDPQRAMSQSFNSLVIRDLILNHARDPDWTGTILYDPDTGVPEGLHKDADGMLRLWLQLDHRGRVPAAEYAAACDLSQGTGATPSCLSIGNVGTGQKVGELLTARMDPKEFAALAVAVCQLFADDDGQGALLVWEVPGPGLSFGPKVRELGYSNRWKRVREDLLTGQKTENEGWVNNPKNANKLLLEYRIALEKRQFLNYSERALKQTGAFKFDASGNESSAESASVADPSGAKINHGDIVIADAMLWLLMKGQGPQGRKAVPDDPPDSSLAGRRRLRQDRARSDGWTQGGRACLLPLR